MAFKRKANLIPSDSAAKPTSSTRGVVDEKYIISIFALHRREGSTGGKKKRKPNLRFYGSKKTSILEGERKNLTAFFGVWPPGVGWRSLAQKGAAIKLS